MDKLKSIDTIVQQFNLVALDKSDWTHTAHLVVAIWHIKTYGFTDAVCQLRSKIIALNNFHQTKNNKDSGYHETLTVFWAKTIDAYIKRHESLSFQETVDIFLSSAFASRELPFEFYKREEILSSDYRAVYHKPTLKELIN